MKQKIQYDHTYEFDLTGRVQFGDLPTATVHALFQDGRVASKFLENILPVWFDDLEYVDQDGYDHVQTSTGRKLDLKGFTRGGASYAPSNMLGAGRKIDREKLHEHALTIDYILSDITQFPKVRIVFKRGTELVETYPSGKIGADQQQVLFD
jgi:hypothetical protein